MKKKNIIPLQPKQAKGITGPKAKSTEAKAPEGAPPQAQNLVVIYTKEQIDALKNWLYDNLTGRQMDNVMQFINLGQTGSFNLNPPETKKN